MANLELRKKALAMIPAGGAPMKPRPKPGAVPEMGEDLDPESGKVEFEAMMVSPEEKAMIEKMRAGGAEGAPVDSMADLEEDL